MLSFDILYSAYLNQKWFVEQATDVNPDGIIKSPYITGLMIWHQSKYVPTNTYNCWQMP